MDQNIQDQSCQWIFEKQNLYLADVAVVYALMAQTDVESVLVLKNDEIIDHVFVMVKVIFLQQKSLEDLSRIALAFLKHPELLEEIEQLEEMKEAVWEITSNKYGIAGYIGAQDLVWKVIFFWCEQHFIFPYNHPTPSLFLNAYKE